MLDQTLETLVLKVSPNVFSSTLMTQNAGASGILMQSTQVVLNLTLGTNLSSGSAVQIKFPKLNPDAPSSQQKSMVNPATLKCSRISTNLNPTLTCSFSASNDTLQIMNINPEMIQTNTSIVFLIEGVINPINYQKVTITVRTVTPDLKGIVDQSTALKF